MVVARTPSLSDHQLQVYLSVIQVPDSNLLNKACKLLGWTALLVQDEDLGMQTRSALRQGIALLNAVKDMQG